MFSEEKLQNALRKCELQYRADNDGYKPLEWLTPHCSDTKEIARFLREIGFRVERIYDSEGYGSEPEHFVETCTGVIVHALRDGQKDAVYTKAK